MPRDLTVDADFEGGNVAGVRVLSPSHVRFEAAAHSSPRPLWFYFRLSGGSEGPVRCDLSNADACLGPRFGWRSARPVYRTQGATWERVQSAAYVEESPDRGTFSFTVPHSGQETWVAYAYPYGVTDLERFLESLPRARHLCRSELCRSAAGQPVPYLRFGAAAEADREVWLIARQHAGETPASYAMEGVVGHLARGVPERVTVHVVPMVDVDGVRHGHYGKDQAPVDFNRDWRDYPILRQTSAIVRRIRAGRGRGRPDLILDLHASHHGDTSCYLFGFDPEPEGRRMELQRQLMSTLAAHSPAEMGFRATDIRFDRAPGRSARGYFSGTLEIPTLTVELSYHLAQSGAYLTPDDYRAFGAAIAAAALAPGSGSGTQ